MRRQKKAMSAPPDAWVTRVLNLRNTSAPPADFARELPQCPVRQETLAGELRTPAFARLAAKAAAVVTAAVATAPEAPGAVRPVLTSARTITRTGYQATKVTGGSGWKTLVAGAVLAVIGIVMATQGMLAIGLTGVIVALVGAYLIALGAWGIHRGALTAIAAITALALPALLILSWVRTQIWGTGKDTNSGLGTQGRPAMAARQLVGRAGRSRWHHPARRPDQPDPPAQAAAQRPADEIARPVRRCCRRAPGSSGVRRQGCRRHCTGRGGPRRVGPGRGRVVPDGGRSGAHASRCGGKGAGGQGVAHPATPRS